MDGFNKMHVSSPNYLKTLLKRDELIYLCTNRPKPKEDTKVEDDLLLSAKQEVGANLTNLDLTGNPLETELEEGDSIKVEFEVKKEEINWSPDEEKHYPMSLKDARRLINDHIRGKASEDYIYAVCDGADSERIVLLGALRTKSEFKRVQVFCRGCFSDSHTCMSLESMQEAHQENSFGLENAMMVEYNASWTYDLTSSVTPVNNCTGTVLLEVTSEDCNICSTILNANLIVRVSAGNPISEVYQIWEQLKLICFFVDQLKHADNNSDENLLFSEDSLDCNFIEQEFVQLLDEYSSFRKISKDEQSVLNLDDLRTETFMDKLWKLLKCVGSLDDLQYLFNTLLYNMGESHNLNLNFSKDDKSTFATIVNAILANSLAVPTVTKQLALEFLVEIGLEKLKNDYSCIIAHYVREPCMLEDWGEQAEDLKSIRKTRLTCVPKRMTKYAPFSQQAPSISLLPIERKLHALARMHLIIEFYMLIAKYCKLSEEQLQQTTKLIYEKFISPESPVQKYSNLSMGSSFEFSTSLNYDVSNVESSPIMWALKLTTKCEDASATTIFHKLQQPLFPPVIFDDYDVPVADDDQEIYYFTEFVEYVCKL